MHGAKIGTCDTVICRIGRRYGEAPMNRQPAALSDVTAERHTVCWSSPYT